MAAKSQAIQSGSGESHGTAVEIDAAWLDVLGTGSDPRDDGWMTAAMAAEQSDGLSSDACKSRLESAVSVGAFEKMRAPGRTATGRRMTMTWYRPRASA